MGGRAGRGALICVFSGLMQTHNSVSVRRCETKFSACVDEGGIKKSLAFGVNQNNCSRGGEGGGSWVPVSAGNAFDTNL